MIIMTMHLGNIVTLVNEKLKFFFSYQAQINGLRESKIQYLY